MSERGAVEGYPDRLSAMPGESVGLCCAGRGRFSIEVARLGVTRDVVWRRDDLEAIDHPVPDDAAQHGCGWPITVEVAVGDDWRSGCYEFDLIPADGSPSRQGCFAVRAPLGRRAPYLLVMATATAAAYNEWGGLNLYTGAVDSSLRRPWGHGFVRRPEGLYLRHAHTITPSRGTIDGVDVNGTRRLADIEAHHLSPWVAETGWSNWEGPFVKWAESHGYSIDVATSTDLHSDPGCLAEYKAMLSVGHDEYWSWEMRDAVETFGSSGGNVAFFSGNNACWQVRFDPDVTRMTSYKFMGPFNDPVVGTPDERRMTGLWSDPMIDRPENHLTGVSFTRGGYVRFGYGVPRGIGWLHGLATPTLGFRRDQPGLRGPVRRRSGSGWLRSRWMCLEPRKQLAGSHRGRWNAPRQWWYWPRRRHTYGLASPRSRRCLRPNAPQKARRPTSNTWRCGSSVIGRPRMSQRSPPGMR